VTTTIHFTAHFLAWHRHFIYQFEQDLINLCGYTGTLPYWEWGLDAAAPQDSVLFNGDAYSMGSNGEYVANRSAVEIISGTSVPPGTGGGCVYSGPFSNYTVTMGPVVGTFDTPVKNSLDYNPHCLKRDLNPYVTQRAITFKNTTTLILNYTTIELFQAVMQADPRYSVTSGQFGVHGGGHLSVGPALFDPYSSPGDPMFYLHHAQIDRAWWIWQSLDLKNRQYAIYGTHTNLNQPPSSNMTLDETIDFGFVAKPVTFRDLMNTLSGPYCYVYA
jgi:tyrosinase